MLVYLTNQSNNKMVQQSIFCGQPDSTSLPIIALPNSEETCVSYRQQRRISQGQRQNGRKTRGQTRGKKWKTERDNRLGAIPSCSITTAMKKIVGENANQFITEAGNLVRTMLPLKCRRWSDMEAEKKMRLLNKIKGMWNFVDTEYVDEVVEKQCQHLYRQWRYRLKEKHFNGYTIAQAVENCPQDVDLEEWKWIVQSYWGSESGKRISEKNQNSRKKQKVKGNQGSKSTARILDTLRKYHGETLTQSSDPATENNEEGIHGSQASIVRSNEVQPPPEPEYIKLWELTKRHMDNSWDKVAEEKLEEFKALHKQQVELYGIDNLTVQEAYLKVLGTSPGVINGLGFGPRAPKRMREDKSGEGIDIVHQMAQRMEQMENNFKEREAGLKREIERLRRESEERESRMNADLKALQDKIAAFFAQNY